MIGCPAYPLLFVMFPMYSSGWFMSGGTREPLLAVRFLALECRHEALFNPIERRFQALAFVHPADVSLGFARFSPRRKELVGSHAFGLGSIGDSVFPEDLAPRIERQHGIADPGIFQNLFAGGLARHVLLS
jgi:hypothetical protein